MSRDADGMSTVTELTWSPPAAGSRYGDQRYWRPGYRQLTVWQVAPEDDWYWQSAVSAGQVGRRRVPAVHSSPGSPHSAHITSSQSIASLSPSVTPPRPFTPDLNLISFINPFLHSHSYSFLTDFTDLNLYWIKGALRFVLVSGYVC